MCSLYVRRTSKFIRLLRHHLNTSVTAKCLRKMRHFFPIPPLVPKTSGVKELFFTSTILSRYFLFFSFSCDLKISIVALVPCEGALTCVTRTSKNVVCPVSQKSLALMSSLASSSVDVVCNLNTSLSIFVSCGSTSTLLHTLVSDPARRFRSLSCLADMKPPFLQHRAWSTEKVFPHGQLRGIFCRGILYRNLSESRN